MEFPILFYYDSSQHIETRLLIKQVGTDLLFEFGSPPFASDTLSSFRELEFVESNFHCIRLRGGCSRCFSFCDDAGFSAFSLFLQKWYDLSFVQRSDSRRFTLRRRSSDAPVRLPASTAKKSLLFNRDPIKRSFHPTHPFSFSSSAPPLSSAPPPVSARAVYSQLVRPDLDSELRDYLSVRAQWELITEEQWLNNRTLREYVAALERSIAGARYGPSALRQLLSNVMISCMYLSLRELCPRAPPHANP